MKTKQKIKVEIVDQDTPIKGFWIDTILTACGLYAIVINEKGMVNTPFLAFINVIDDEFKIDVKEL